MTLEFPNLRHLSAFHEVGRLKGISAAAEVVHLSQPAVTQAIAGLERELEETLFDRRPEGMFLTGAGAVFHARVGALLAHLEQGAVAAIRAANRREDRPSHGFHTRATAAQLRALVAVGDAGTFSLAAKAVGVSQPSLHRAARDLEKLAGLALFTPWRRGIALTPAGEELMRAVRLAHAELRQGRAELSARRGRDVSRINVGAMPLSRSAILPGAIHALIAENDGVQIRSVDGPYGELLRGLRHGDLDLLIGALRDPPPAEDVVQEVLFDDRLVLVVGPRHPLTQVNAPTLEDTLAFPWVAPPITTPAGVYLCQALGIEALPNTPVRVVSSSMMLVRGLLMQGDYVTIMSRNQLGLEAEQGRMQVLPIPLKGSARPIGLTTRMGWRPTPTQARFLELLRISARSVIEKTNSREGQ